MEMKVRYWIWFWLAPLAGAQPLSALVDEALRNNREILAAQKKVEALRQRPARESSLPDPMISLGYNSVGNPLPGAGLGSQALANVGVMVSQEVPFPGKLKLKGDMASKEAQAEFQQYQAVQLAVISRLKQAYYRLQYTYAATDLLIRDRDLLERLLKVTEDRYSVGRAAQQDRLGQGAVDRRIESGDDIGLIHQTSTPPPNWKKERKKLEAAKAIDRPKTIWISRRNPPEVSPNARVRPVMTMMITDTTLATGPWTDSRI